MGKGFGLDGTYMLYLASTGLEPASFSLYKYLVAFWRTELEFW
jgi:hypothetical protein